MINIKIPNSEENFPFTYDYISRNPGIYINNDHSACRFVKIPGQQVLFFNSYNNAINITSESLWRKGSKFQKVNESINIEFVSEKSNILDEVRDAAANAASKWDETKNEEYPYDIAYIFAHPGKYRVKSTEYTYVSDGKSITCYNEIGQRLHSTDNHETYEKNKFKSYENSPYPEVKEIINEYPYNFEYVLNNPGKYKSNGEDDRYFNYVSDGRTVGYFNGCQQIEETSDLKFYKGIQFKKID